jgi:hypothetical protein
MGWFQFFIADLTCLNTRMSISIHHRQSELQQGQLAIAIVSGVGYGGYQWSVRIYRRNWSHWNKHIRAVRAEHTQKVSRHDDCEPVSERIREETGQLRIGFVLTIKALHKPSWSRNISYYLCRQPGSIAIGTSRGSRKKAPEKTHQHCKENKDEREQKQEMIILSWTLSHHHMAAT